MEANKAQIQAINHFRGPMLVLAGPGSGKTTVITRRTQELIEQYGIKPQRILVVTFSKAAATEMKERFIKLMGGRNSQVNFGTFHAVFFKILKYAYNYNAANILREEERYEILRQIIAGMDTEHDDEKEFMLNISNEISLVKGSRISPENYYSMNCSVEDFRYIYSNYEKSLRKIDRIDFDDMLLLCYELLAQRQDILKLWQEKYEFILIDEFQDISPLQYRIVKMLAKPQDNLFIVGDDDQSIYRFRGASPEIMLNFKKEYPQGEVVALEHNYRSQPDIMKAASRLISNNKNRYEKKITAVRKPGGEPEISEFDKISNENDRIVEKIKEYRKQGISYSQMAVLFRTNNEPRTLMERLMDNCIPFKSRDNIPNLYDHWITQNILTYMNIAEGSDLRSDYLSIINRPKRYISRESLTTATTSITQLKSFYSDKEYMLERIERLEYDLRMLKGMKPYAAVNYIKKAIGYDDFLKEYAQFRHADEQELLAISDELAESAKQAESLQQWKQHMEKYKQELELREKQSAAQLKDCVTIATYHAAKGLEYSAVFLPDVNENVVPHKKAVMPEELEEERRMFYVAMTRAKDYLNVYYVKERFGRKVTKSRFVSEMQLSAGELQPDMIITHKTYGKGKVIRITENRITVKFERIVLPKVLDLGCCIREGLITYSSSPNISSNS